MQRVRPAAGVSAPMPPRATRTATEASGLKRTGAPARSAAEPLGDAGAGRTRSRCRDRAPRPTQRTSPCARCRLHASLGRALGFPRSDAAQTHSRRARPASLARWTNTSASAATASSAGATGSCSPCSRSARAVRCIVWGSASAGSSGAPRATTQHGAPRMHACSGVSSHVPDHGCDLAPRPDCRSRQVACEFPARGNTVDADHETLRHGHRACPGTNDRPA